MRNTYKLIFYLRVTCYIHSCVLFKCNFSYVYILCMYVLCMYDYNCKYKWWNSRQIKITKRETYKVDFNFAILDHHNVFKEQHKYLLSFSEWLGMSLNFSKTLK